MSYFNLEMALKKAEECDDFFAKECVDTNVIRKAELTLKIDFSKQQKLFLEKYTYFSFFGNEFYGIIKDDFTGNYTPQIVVATLVDRERANMPHSYLHLWDAGDGAIAILDYSNLNEDSEPPVLLVDYRGEEQGWVVLDKIADDLGDFLLQLVERQLANQ